MKKLAVVVFLAAFAFLAGCTAIVKVEGDHVVNERMTVTVTEAWNKVSLPGDQQPYDMWTQEGITLDHLRFWAAIKPGQPMMRLPRTGVPMGQTAPRVPTFMSGMAPDQLISLFEVLYSADGSIVKMTRIEPAQFAGERGLRFEFSVARKRDDVQLMGVGWVSVRNQELFAATFAAPRLAFFPRLLPMAEAVVKTARIKG
jgi:hypothetical protein